MFGLGRRRDVVRQVHYAGADVSAIAACGELERYLRFVDAGHGDGSDERSLLLRLASEPVARGNALPPIGTSRSEVATAQSPAHV